MAADENGNAEKAVGAQAQAEVDPQTRRTMGAALSLAQMSLQLAQSQSLSLGQLFEAHLTASIHLLSYLLLHEKPTQQWKKSDRLELVKMVEQLAERLHEAVRELHGHLEIGGDAFLQELRAREQALRQAASRPHLVDSHGRRIQ